MNEQLDILELIASDPLHASDSDRIRAAIVRDGKAHGGIVNSNRVRESLRNDDGNAELDVFHKVIGAQYSALRAAGLIEQAGPPMRSTDTHGRNAGRWMPQWRLTSKGWLA